MNTANGGPYIETLPIAKNLMVVHAAFTSILVVKLHLIMIVYQMILIC